MKIIVKYYGPGTVTDPDYPKDLPNKHFNVWGDNRPTFEQQGTHEYEVDSKHLFDDQVNTTCGKRIHDWADYMSPNRHMRWGHYVVNIDELNKFRHQYFKCGYCGNMDQTGGWCQKCRGSEFLTPDVHHLLHMVRLGDKREKLPIPDDVLGTIHHDQKATDARKLKRKRLQILAEIEKKETDLLFHDIVIKRGLTFAQISNCIHYSHKDKFCFGWKTPVSVEEADIIAKAMEGTPFELEFVTV